MTKKEEISFEDGKRKLPDGWRWVKLSEISRLVSGWPLDQKLIAITKATTTCVGSTRCRISDEEVS